MPLALDVQPGYVAALGALTGIALLLGGLLANVPLLAVGAMAALGPATALAAARSRAGEILLNLTFPRVGSASATPTSMMRSRRRCS